MDKSRLAILNQMTVKLGFHVIADDSVAQIANSSAQVYNDMETHNAHYCQKHARPRANTEALVTINLWKQFSVLYECLYNQNSKYFKDKNKKANSWAKITEKIQYISVSWDEKFRTSRSAYKRYCSERKCHHLDRDDIFCSLRILESRLTEPAHCPQAVLLIIPLAEVLCDHLRCFAICDPRSSEVVRGHMETRL